MNDSFNSIRGVVFYRVYMFFTTLKFQERLFNMVLVFTSLFYITTLLGKEIISPTLFMRVDYYIKLYIAAFLVVRYNPVIKTTRYTALDKKVSFHAGVFILFTMFIRGIMTDYLGINPKWLSSAGLCS